MSGFSELIKNFSKTRDYVRDFFIYGFKVRSDFGRKSSRTYDDEKRRAESWLGDFVRCDSSVRGKQIYISVDSGHIPENPLYQVYWSRSFTDNDIRLHFMLLDLLSGEKPLTLSQICTGLVDSYGAVFEDQTVRNKLKEYVQEGIVLSERSGRTSYFRLSPDTVDSFISEYEGLPDALKFFSEAPEFGVVGNSLLRAAGLRNDLFLMKHSYIVHALEDAVLPEITEAITRKRFITVRIAGSKGTAGESEEHDFLAVPMQILVSVQTGRRYLAAYVPAFRRFNTFRLDFLRRVTEGEECTDFDSLYGKYIRNSRRCFGVSFGMRRDTGTVTPMRITFRADEKEEGYIIDRLGREKRCGSLARIGEGLYTVTLDVFDPNEVMHWVKTFIGRIVSVEGGSKPVRDRFYSDIRRMYQMYSSEGGNTDDHIQ